MFPVVTKKYQRPTSQNLPKWMNLLITTPQKVYEPKIWNRALSVSGT